MGDHYIADVDGNLDAATADEIKEAFPELAAGFDALETAHGEIVVCNTKAGVAAFRVPKGPEYERFLGGLLGDQKDAKVKAGKILAVACCVFPERPVFQSWVERYPGIPSACTKPLNKLMGGELAARGKD